MDCLLQKPFFYIYMSLDDGEERKHWLKLSFSFGKKLKPKQGDLPLSKGGTHTLNAAALLFARCSFASIPLTQLGRQGDALPWAAALSCSICAAKHYFVIPWLFLTNTCICSTQGNTNHSDPPELPPFLSQRPCPGHKAHHHAELGWQWQQGMAVTAAAHGPSCPSPTQTPEMMPTEFPMEGLCFKDSPCWSSPLCWLSASLPEILKLLETPCSSPGSLLTL